MVVIIEWNFNILEKIVAVEVDVMTTDNVEAMIESKDNPPLYAVYPTNT